MDFGEEGLIENPIRNGVTPDWFDCNCADLNWSIVNMTVSDSVMLFNTNREYAFMVNTDRKSGGGYLNFHNDMLPFSFSRIIPTGGLPGTVVYRPFAETIAETLKQYREKMARFPLSCKRWSGSSIPTAIRSSSCGKSNDRSGTGVCKGGFKVFGLCHLVVVLNIIIR